MKERIVHIQYCDDKSILIVTSTGKIIQLIVPFRVISIQAVGAIPIQTLVYVEGVFSNEKNQLIYNVWGRYYFHFYFQIVLTN